MSPFVDRCRPARPGSDTVAGIGAVSDRALARGRRRRSSWTSRSDARRRRTPSGVARRRPPTPVRAIAVDAHDGPSRDGERRRRRRPRRPPSTRAAATRRRATDRRRSSAAADSPSRAQGSATAGSRRLAGPGRGDRLRGIGCGRRRGEQPAADRLERGADGVALAIEKAGVDVACDERRMLEQARSGTGCWCGRRGSGSARSARDSRAIAQPRASRPTRSAWRASGRSGPRSRRLRDAGVDADARALAARDRAAADRPAAGSRAAGSSA